MKDDDAYSPAVALEDIQDWFKNESKILESAERSNYEYTTDQRELTDKTQATLRRDKEILKLVEPFSNSS